VDRVEHVQNMLIRTSVWRQCRLQQAVQVDSLYTVTTKSICRITQNQTGRIRLCLSPVCTAPVYRLIKPPLATARAAQCIGAVRLFVARMQKNAIFSKTKQFRAMVSIDDL